MKPKKPLNHQSKLRILAANSCQDILNKIDSKWVEFTNEKVNANITCVHSVDQLTQDEYNWINDLTENNMKVYYEQSENGWNRKQKEKEFRHETARFLLCHLKSGQSNDQLIAFVHFRFELDYDEKHPILYCYEIQVTKDYQSCGLGRHLMLMLQEIASKFQMKSVLLTCFRHNERSYKFYQNLDYKIHHCSPSKCGMEASYEILYHRVGNTH